MHLEIFIDGHILFKYVEKRVNEGQKSIKLYIESKWIRFLIGSFSASIAGIYAFLS